MYSAYKLNKQGNNIKPLCTPFPIWNQSVVPCPVLTVASRPTIQIYEEAGKMVFPFLIQLEHLEVLGSHTENWRINKINKTGEF